MRRNHLLLRGLEFLSRLAMGFFLLVIIGKVAWLACCPNLIFLVEAQMLRFALLMKSMPMLQGNCRLSMNWTGISKDRFARKIFSK